MRMRMRMRRKIKSGKKREFYSNSKTKVSKKQKLSPKQNKKRKYENQ